jgi:maltodextrin utilization protein YvdJ
MILPQDPHRLTVVQRSLFNRAETSYSTTKRSLGDAVRALDWYRQFREIVLMFAITNIESLCEPL